MLRDGMPAEGWREWPAILLDGILAVELGAQPRRRFDTMHAKACDMVMESYRKGR